MSPDPASADHTEIRRVAIDRYLNELCWAMGGTFAEQQALRDELRAHISEAIREHELGGLSPDDALMATLRDFGPPSDLGRSMRASTGKRPLARPLTQPSGALLLERRSIRHLPPRALILAVAASGVTALAVAITYAWP
jgi:hypothetical protein